MAIRHDIHTRMFLNDAWRDVTDTVRVKDGINISRGRPDESSTTPPQTASLVLDNRTGDYSIRNPVGQWYGTLGRNNPIEICKYIAQDDASATVASGWGTTETGTSGVLSTYTWTVTGGSASDYAKAAGKATHAVTSTNTRRLSYLSALTQRDVDITVTVSVNVTNITGAAIASDVVLRGVSLASTRQVAARMYVETNESVTVDFVDGNGDSWPGQGVVTISGITHTSSQSLKIRAQAEGQTFRVKVWAATAGEPLDWAYTWTNTLIDADYEAVAYVRGWVGIGSVRLTGNTNGTVTFSYDDLVVASQRFAGEVANFPTGGDPSARERTASIEASGVLRRLLQGNNPLKSAPRRFIPTDGQGIAEVVYYWPLEDGPLVENAQPVIGEGPLVLTSTQSPERVFGQGTLAPWLAPSVQLQGPDTFSTIPDINITGFVAADGWMFDFIRSEGDRLDTAVQLLYGTTGGFDILFDVSAQTISVTDDVTTINMPYPAAFDGGVHHIRLSANGAGTIAWDLLVDGTSIGGNTYAGTLDEIFYVLISNSLGSNPMSIGHVAIYNGTFSTSAFEAWNAAFGFRGETAGRRIQRLCSENDIDFAWIGDLDTTETMGPQGVRTLVELIQECVDVDQGTLYESKGTLGLVYRTRAATYTQDALVTLDASQGQVGYPFEPIEDDQFIFNNIVAQRVNGGQYEVELTTGRMSTTSPPDGIGRYDTQLNVNPETDAQLVDYANWQLALGTVDEPRFPGLNVDLDAPASTQFEDELLDLTADDLVTITNPSAVGIYDTVRVLARGYNEFWTNHRHVVELNASPYSPYDVEELDSNARLDSGSSTLNASLTTTATSVSVATSNVFDLWATTAANPGEFPFDIIVNGERMTVTAITGSTSPQTFTVTRSVNGVVKAHSSGEEVHVFQPIRLGL